MTHDAPTVTVDLLVAMLKQVMDENPTRDRAKMERVVWDGGTVLDDTGFNSYDLVELVFKIEDQFGIEIDYNANNSINNVRTIGELCDEIGKLVAKKQAA